MQNIYDLANQHRMLAESSRSIFARLSPNVGDYKWSCRQDDFNGWMLCDGRSLSSEKYMDLFAIIGTAFGEGDSCEGTEFKIPDFRGRIMGAVGQGIGLTHRLLGSDVGEETHTLTENEMPNHVHTGTTDTSGSHTHSTNAIGGQGNVGLCTANGGGTAISSDSSPFELNVMTTPTALVVDANGNHVHTFTSGSAGSGQAHNNMQPTLYGGSVFIYTGYGISFV